MKNSHPLNPYILSVLFNLSSEEDGEKIFAEFEPVIEKVIDKALTDFLLSKGFSESQLLEFFNSKEPEKFPEIVEQIQNLELPEYLYNQVDQFNKKIYDEQYPKLSEEKRQELDLYLQETDNQTLGVLDNLIQTFGAVESPDNTNSAALNIPNPGNNDANLTTDNAQPAEQPPTQSTPPAETQQN